MITLDSIRIRNFRAIKELTFKPQQEGITGIFGPNGAGKSSILTAVMFALYGVRPKDITIGALRKTGSEGEECSVSVVFTHLGQTVEIVREISGKDNVVIANIYVDGEAETTTKPTAANKWIVKRLGIEAEGFLTAFVIRQKELDAFVKAVPSERKRIIEKLAGVETINKALKSAREDERDSRKTVDLLPGSQEQVDASAEEVAYYTEQAEETQESITMIETTLTALTAEREEYQKLINEHSEHSRQLERVQSNIEALQKELPDLEAQLERLAYVKELKDSDDVVSLREQHKTVTATLQELRNEYSSIENQKAVLSRELEQATSALNALNAELQSLNESLTTDRSELSTLIQKKKEEATDLSNEGIRIKSQNADLAESLEILAGEHQECPTCKTHLDDPEKLRNQLQGIIDSNTERYTQLRERHAALTGEIVELEKTQESFLYYDDLTQKQQTTEEVVASTTAGLESLADMDELLTKIQATEAEQQKVLELGLKAKSIGTDRQLFQELTTRKADAELKLHQATTDEQRLNAQLHGVVLSEVERKFQDVSRNYQQLLDNRNELSSKLAEYNVRFDNSRSNYTRLYNQWEKKKGLQEAHEAKTLTTDMLDRFRQDVVSSIAPEISDYATTLISSMTDGYFTEVKLDDDFRASVINSSGEELASSWLSGGEESAVALALRLAVSFLITGGNPNLLWLDEPLTAQDKDRRASILTMIRELPIQQILLINHAQEAQDIVDHEITLTKEG